MKINLTKTAQEDGFDFRENFKVLNVGDEFLYSFDYKPYSPETDYGYVLAVKFTEKSWYVFPHRDSGVDFPGEVFELNQLVKGDPCQAFVPVTITSVFCTED